MFFIWNSQKNYYFTQYLTAIGHAGSGIGQQMHSIRILANIKK